MCHLRHLFLLTLCLDDLSIDVSVVFKSPTIILLLLISPFMFVYWAVHTDSLDLPETHLIVEGA